MADKTAEQRLHGALEAALDRYERLLGAAYSGSAHLTIRPYDEFQALAVPDEGGMRIIVTTGVVDAISTLWHRIMAYCDQAEDGHRLNVGDGDQAIDASLMFLMLHELHHHCLEHFRLSGPSGIAETSLHIGFGLSSRDDAEPSPLARIDPDHRRLYRRCMELQADHDAMELMFDAYSADGWEYLRFYAAAIFAVMVLIDREEGLPEDQRDHPKAATRMFQMLGTLSTLWMPLHDHPETMPDDAEIAAYHSAVVVPAMADARLIAVIADAPSVVEALGSMDDFVMDFRALQHPEHHDLSALRTAGAREYAALSPINEEVIAMIGPERFYR